MFENHRKSLIQHCERSELRLHFEWTKVHYKCQKWSILASFWKPEACGQTVLADRSILIGQKNWWKMPKLKNSNATFWVIFKQFDLDRIKKIEDSRIFLLVWYWYIILLNHCSVIFKLVGTACIESLHIFLSKFGFWSMHWAFLQRRRRFLWPKGFLTPITLFQKSIFCPKINLDVKATFIRVGWILQASKIQSGFSQTLLLGQKLDFQHSVTSDP